MAKRLFYVAKRVFFWRYFLENSKKAVSFYGRVSLSAAFSSSLLIPYWQGSPAVAQTGTQLNEYCQLSPAAVNNKEKLRLSAMQGNKEAQIRYREQVAQHAKGVQQCRNRNWLKVQAVWLRLYPCDMKAGALEQIMDRIVSKGYNAVYLETFYDGRVMLPAANNPTVWPSVIQMPEAKKADLLAVGIKKGRERGLKVYAWMYTTNFGYSYAQRREKESAIARNGKGQTSLYVVDGESQVFVDPYNEQAKADYFRLVQEVVRRRPDGILFDYVRYPRQSGTDSIATKVTDLWLYTEATQKFLFKRAQNYKGLDLIRRFLSQGFVSEADIADVDRLYPQEGEPSWQGRTISNQKSVLPLNARQEQLQWDLWQLSVAHAMQGIVDFVTMASYPAKQLGISTGAVFFPEGNQIVGRGYDSRLQPWDRFPSSMEWHAMSYANCGNANCIAQQVARVLSMAKSQTQVIPAIAGNWGESVKDRPPLEVQMQALKQFAPRLRGVSHFAYSWQDFEHDSDRKFCRAQ